MQTIFQVYNDPSHGWCKVPISVLEAIGLTVEDFSPYSYRNGENTYLEEDCDLGVFAAAYTLKTGKPPVFNNRYCNGRSRIRNYPSIRTGNS